MQADAAFDAVGARIRQIRRSERAQVGQRAAERDDLVGEIVVEIGHVQRGSAAPKLLLHACIAADAALRLQRGIIGESQLESVGRANSRAKAAVNARQSKNSV